MSTNFPTEHEGSNPRAPGDLYADVARARSRQVVFGEPSPMPRLGRYTVIRRLGAGGMAEVFAAYDPNLDRGVALKLIRSSTSERGGKRTTRLVREARAMAKVDHPNVVPVFEVDELKDGRVFVAMALVRGQTLRQWIAAEHGWREIIDVFLAAAGGLQAAHDAGLVHRDFKPENTMIGEDGRVQVMDFGLAEHTVGSKRDRITTDREPGRESRPNQIGGPEVTLSDATFGTPS